MLTIYAGHDPREEIGFDVFERSVRRRCREAVDVIPVSSRHMRQAGLYRRPETVRDGQRWDVISDAPMSTAFSVARFCVGALASRDWVLFADGADMLCLGDIAELFALADDRYAVMCVQHDAAQERGLKMDGVAQRPYPRKWWSSLFLYNPRHPANRRLTLELINTAHRDDLHRFAWLPDGAIGALPNAWNHLAGVEAEVTPVRMVHYTLGAPFMAGHEAGPLADLWHRERAAA